MAWAAPWVVTPAFIDAIHSSSEQNFQGQDKRALPASCMGHTHTKSRCSVWTMGAAEDILTWYCMILALQEEGIQGSVCLG